MCGGAEVTQPNDGTEILNSTLRHINAQTVRNVPKPSRKVGFLNKKLVEVDSAVGLDYEGDPAEGRTKISSLTFSK